MEENTVAVATEDREINLDSMPGWDEEGETSPETALPEAPAQEEGAQEEAAAETAQPEAQPEGQQPAPQDGEELHTIKYNGQELQLNAKDLVTLAQKGMNYDKMQARLDQAMANPQLRAMQEVLEPYARQAGMDVGSYVQYLQKSADDQAVQRMVEGGMPLEAAQRMYALEKENRALAEQRNREAQQQTQQNAFVPLLQKYPEVKTLDAGVQEEIRSGVPPLAAYEKWLLAQENARLKAETAAAKVAEKNKQSAPGSAQSAGAGEEESGLWSGFSTGGYNDDY